jgi:hypothetical protein
MPGEEDAPDYVKIEMILLATERDHLIAAAKLKEKTNG